MTSKNMFAGIGLTIKEDEDEAVLSEGEQF